jgi:hypothetical protein
MCLRVSYKKKYEKNYFFCMLKVTEERVRSGVGSGSISQRCGSGSPTLSKSYCSNAFFLTGTLIGSDSCVLVLVLVLVLVPTV